MTLRRGRTRTRTRQRACAPVRLRGASAEAYLPPMRCDALPTPPPSAPLGAPALPPSPAVLAWGRDPASLRAAIARLSRPLVCACGCVEGAPGAAPVGAVVRPLRAAAASVEAVCARCAPDPRQLVSLGALPSTPRGRRAPVRALPAPLDARAAGAPMTGVMLPARTPDAG